MKKLPKISIVIVTLNNERTLEKCVRAIMIQDYPKDLVEYINVDGGSTDMSGRILKKYGFKIIPSPIKKNAEAQRAIGLKEAKNNIVFSIDADNYLPNSQWLKQMVKPFIDDPKIIHAGTIYYAYKKNDSLMNRYCALFGVVDPMVYYVGKPDRLPQNVRHWSRGEVISETDDYYTVEFTKETLPTVGCNGVAYRRDILLKYAKSSPSQFIHIDVFIDLIEKGYSRFAIVKNDVFHDTAVDIGKLLKKRIAFLSSYYFKNKIGATRRYFIYNPKSIKDNVRLLLFVFYTVTFVKPILDSLKGYFFLRDKAWFLHPIVCWVYLYAYSYATIKKLFKQV
jgi:glycosyltransferase involved in cell wall biosynthesis